MTTANITAEPNEGKPRVTATSIVADLGRLGSAARRRADELTKEVKGIDTQADNVNVGARVAEQKLADDRSILEEEAEQLQWILKGTTRQGIDEFIDDTPPAPADDITVPPFDNNPDWLEALYTRDELGHMSDSQLLELATAYSYEGVNTQRAALIVFILNGQHVWCMDNEVDDPAVIAIDVRHPRRIHTVINVRKWSKGQWVIAVMVGFIAFIIAMISRHFPGWHGFPRSAFAFVWVVAVITLGFFFGGLIGSIADRIDDRYREEEG